MANIVDYIRDGVTSAKTTVSDYITGAADKVKGIAGGVKDATTKAVNPPRGDWINNTRKNYEVNKYKVDQHSYPMDLLSPIYGGNYAIFYINVSDASRLALTEETVDLNPKTEARMRGSLVGNAKRLENLFDAGVNKANEVLPEAANINIDAIKNAVPFNGRSQRRLKTAIALHVPNQLSVRYATTWGTAENTAGAQALMSAGSSVGEALANNPTAAIKNLTDAAATGAEAFVANKMANNKYSQIISAATGTAANPKKEQVFEGVEFRKFAFDYQFYPRDEFEAENVLNIIHQFKLHMHPEFKSELNYVWIYPSEFDITYYTNGAENLNLHKHTSCILESMNVNYTPNGNFSVFANGMPTQINLSLEFRELQLASKETIGLTPGGL
jgi:hypothetical protein